MGFKARIFGETLILCVLLILDSRNIVNGCQLFNPDGVEVNITGPLPTIYVGVGIILDDQPPGLVSSFSTAGVASVVQDPAVESKYLEHSFTDTTLNILLSDSYKDWKRIEAENFTTVSVALKLDCSPKSIVFRTQLNNFTNIYPPEFPKSSYNITLPMPLPAGYTIVGECGEMIEVTDYDYHIRYMSDVTISLKDTTEDLEVTALKRDGKKWAVILKTTNTFRIEEPLTVTLVAEDVPPPTQPGDSVLTSEVTITIMQDKNASTPATPLFEKPIYVLDIKQEEDIKPVVATLIDGITEDYEVELVYSHGEDLKDFFETDIDGAKVTLAPDESLASTEFSDNFGVLILEAKHPGTNRIGKTVIHVILPGNYVTPPPSTTETTLPCTCPTEDTTYTTDTTTPTQEITQCPEPTTLPCTCPTEETTLISDATKPTEESTQCPEVTITTEASCPEMCTCPPTPSCPTEEPPTTSPFTSDTGGTTTTTANTHTCEPCDCTPGTPETSTAPPQERSIYFTDPKAIVYIYGQQMNYIKTMSAFCISVCKIQYEILDGPLSSSLIIDHETGDINITENIKQGGLFDVQAVAEIGGINYTETARVQLSVMTLQPCPDGSYWDNTLTVNNVEEEIKQYDVQKCDFVDGCGCSIAKVIPEEAREYFREGEVVALTKSIDREDTDLFPDQSNTYIILHLELSCETDNKTIYKFWDERPRSAIDDIGTIKYDPLRTVFVLQIEDINDNRPEFDIPSLTVGYPNAEIAHQLLPPYLVKVQATDADFGENAIIKYSLVPDGQFFIHQETGVIYPVAEAFIYEDTQFTVYANDSVGAGEPLEVNVKILSSDNLLVIKQKGSLLEDINDLIVKIANNTLYDIKLLSASVIASDTVVNDAVNKKDDDRQLPYFESMNEPSNTLLQLIIYGLDSEEKLVPYSEIQKDLEGADFTSESWTAGYNCTTDETKPPTQDLESCTDTSLLIAVIVLAVIILLLLGGAAFAYLRYIRPLSKNNDDYYDRILSSSGKSSISEVDENAVSHATEEKRDYANEQLSSKMEEIQPSAPLSSDLTTTKPDQEIVNMIDLNESNQGTTDVKNTENNGDGGEHQDEKNSENIAKPKKSIVTFNNNVQQIEIEEV